MNKVILLGRLTRDPEVRYSSSAEPVAVARYGIAVNRRSKRQGEPDADFFDCVCFGRIAEFAEKYFRKGLMVAVSGRLQNNTWEDKQTGQKRTRAEVIVEEQDFAESKASFESRNHGSSDSYGETPAAPSAPSGFSAIAETVDDDLPF